MNLVILTGRLGKDPDMRYSTKGTAYCRFSLATTERYGGQSKTLWNNMVAWGKLAEICAKYLTKGSKIGVRGRIGHSAYEKDGVKKTSTEIHIDELEFLDSKDSKQSQATSNDPEDLPI